MRSAGILALCAAFLLPAAPAPGGDRDGDGSPGPEAAKSPARRVTGEQQDAIDAGLAWLAKQQAPDGGFPTSDPGGHGPAKSADYRTAVTALSVLAFLGAGEGLSHGRYSATVSRGVQWLLAAQQGDGFIAFGNDDQSKMHGHGFATLALAEAFGTAMTTRDAAQPPATAEEQNRLTLSVQLRKGVQAAVNLVERAQAEQGGWDYFRSSGGKSDHEGSVTVCQVQALQAASNRGFTVSLGRIQKARDYMRRSQVACGGFKYRLSQDEGPERVYTYALAAAGVTSLVGLGDYGRREAVENGMKFLERKFRVPQQGQTDYFFYGSFYAVQAFHWVGGTRWEQFWLPMRRNLLKDQNEDGSWGGRDTQVDLGRVYPTSFTLLMLEVPVEYLSIFAK